MNKYLIGLAALLNVIACQAEIEEKRQLDQLYQRHCSTWSDICEHVSVLRNLAGECESVIEIGIRSMVSTWGVLKGLSENNQPMKRYLGIDLNYPPMDKLNEAKRLSKALDIDFNFLQADDMTIDIEPVDMLFIDSLHTYCHLTYELEKFSPKVKKYIAMHDTSEPWGDRDDTEYHGNYSEYPAEYSRTKRGLWPAVQDFLLRHPEWQLHERRMNNHGFTILKRVVANA